MGFICGLVVTCELVPNKDRLKVVTVNIGENEFLKIVTNAPNIRDGTRTCVATVGSTFEINGQSETVKKTNVGGIVSEGMICDFVMLGWVGGAAGLAVQIPVSYALGSPAPTTKPRMDGSSAPVEAVVELSAKEVKANEKLARKLELAAKKEKRLTEKNDKKNSTPDINKEKEEEKDEELKEKAVEMNSTVDCNIDNLNM